MAGEGPNRPHIGAGQVDMSSFKPDDADACAPAWEEYKAEFLIRLDAAGLYEAAGRRKVGNLLKCMGSECRKLYEAFEWAPAVAAVPADADNNRPAVEARAAEDKYDLEHVFRKFDQHWGVKRYRAIKRQEFLDIERTEGQTIMDFVSELKRKASLCDFGINKESLIIDKIINKVKDERCSERLLELPDEELTLERVISVCRQVELTKAHLKTMNPSKVKDVKRTQATDKSRSQSRGRGYNRGGRRPRPGYQSRFDHSRFDKRNARQEDRPCDRCCRRHREGECRAENEYCGACGVKGHFKRSPLCRAANQSQGHSYKSGRGRGSYRNDRSQYGNSYGRSRGRTVHNVSWQEPNDSFYEDFDSRCNVEDVFVVSCVDDENYYDVKCCDNDNDDYFNDFECYDDVYDVKCCDNDNDDYCNDFECFDDVCAVNDGVGHNVQCFDDVCAVNDDVGQNVECFDDVCTVEHDDVECAVNVKHDAVHDVGQKVDYVVGEMNNNVLDKAESNDEVDVLDMNEIGLFDSFDIFDSCDMKCENAQLTGAEFIEQFDDVDEIVDVFSTSDRNSRYEQDWTVDFDVKGHYLRLELDTAAHCNIISLSTVKRLGFSSQISPSNLLINGVHNESRRAYGTVVLPCVYRGSMFQLNFQVLDSSREVNLLGRPDCLKLRLVARVNSVVKSKINENILNQFKDVLGQEIGCMPGEYEIKLDSNAKPVVHPPRSVPAAIRDQVRKELDHLEHCKIIAKVVEPTDWVNSMVVVRKKNGRVRICIDPSDLNRAIRREHFPMSTIEDIATRLHGSKWFSTLDANSGYFQIRLTEDSSKLTTFNTPFGRYRYLRMPMGLKCAAELFQREMQSQFGDIPGVEVVVDDILIHGKSESEHNAILEKVMQKARKIGLKLNSEKSRIGLPEVNYVGHRLTGEGLKPTAERVAAIVNMRPPENISELETILGMIAYVSKFIPGLSTLNAPLRDLKKREDWAWGAEEQKALDAIKKALTSNTVLKYYDVNKPVVLSVDASSRGLGAALIQDKAVVAYASRSLTDTECKYAQIEKEALAVVFGCTKFHKMLYGRNFVVESDHKPLEVILNKSILSAPMRVQRMMLKLQPYSFTLIHVKGKSLGLADCLSRLPHGPSEQLLDDELMVCPVDTIVGPQHNKFVTATEADQDLQQLKRIIRTGWPDARNRLPPGVAPYWNIRDELSTYNGLVFRGDRIVVPSSLQQEMITQLHKSHMGVVLTKQRARDLMFWPNMSTQIEDKIAKCGTCLQYRNNQPKEPLYVQPLPARPWSKVGADLFELHGKHYILLVDYYSNFVEIEKLESLTTSGVIQTLKRMIARYGIMDILVSDNGPQFASRQFAEFALAYNFTHSTSSPLRAQSNGLAERSIQTVKRLMYKCVETGEDLYLALLDLRNTPRDNLISSPVQRLMGRRTKTRLPTCSELLKPKVVKPSDVTSRLQNYRELQKKYFDRGKRVLPKIQEHDAVRLKTPTGWQPAEYVTRHGQPRSHIVKSTDRDRLYRRNRDQLLITRETPHEMPPPLAPPYVPMNPRQPRRDNPVVRDNPAVINRDQGPQVDPLPPAEIPAQPRQNDNMSRAGRPRKAPVWLKDYERY